MWNVVRAVVEVLALSNASVGEHEVDLPILLEYLLEDVGQRCVIIHIGLVEGAGKSGRSLFAGFDVPVSDVDFPSSSCERSCDCETHSRRCILVNSQAIVKFSFYFKAGLTSSCDHGILAILVDKNN